MGDAKSSKNCDSHRHKKAWNDKNQIYKLCVLSPGIRGVSIGGCFWGFLREMINYKSLFSPVRMDQCQRERDRMRLSCCLFSSQSSHFWPRSLHLISTSQFLNVFEEQSKIAWKEISRNRFLASFPGWLSSPGRCTRHSIFLCAHINDSVAYWNDRVGSSGKIAGEFWDSGQMLDAQYKLR